MLLVSSRRKDLVSEGMDDFDVRNLLDSQMDLRPARHLAFNDLNEAFGFGLWGEENFVEMQMFPDEFAESARLELGRIADAA